MRMLLFFLATLVWCQSAFSAQISTETVRFELPIAPPTALEQKRGIARAEDRIPSRFRAMLRIPANVQDAPAVVLVHTCHGSLFYKDWFDRFNAHGYVTLSFSRCNTQTGKPDDVEHSTFDWKRGAQVAFGALRYLTTRKEVDPSRIAIMGWSRPAMVPLSVLNYEGFSQFFSHQYKTAIAVYPFCSFARGPHRASILIVSAGNDDYVDSNVCRRISNSTKEDEFPITFKVVEGAYHGFDIPKFGPKHWASRSKINPDQYSAGGGTLEYREEYEQILVDAVLQHLKRVMSLGE